MDYMDSMASMEIHGLAGRNVVILGFPFSICRGTIHVSLGSKLSLCKFPYIYMIFLLQRILLAVLDAAVRCSRHSHLRLIMVLQGI